MYSDYIKFGSVTTAQKAQQILYNNGIRSQVGKNPDPKKNEGCGYALFLNGSVRKANDLLIKNGVTSKGVGRVNSK